MLHFQPDSRLALLSFKMFKFWIIPWSEAGSRLKVKHDRDSLNKMDCRGTGFWKIWLFLLQLVKKGLEKYEILQFDKLLRCAFVVVLRGSRFIFFTCLLFSLWRMLRNRLILKKIKTVCTNLAWYAYMRKVKIFCSEKKD